MKTLFTIAFVAFLAVTTSAVATDVHPSIAQKTMTGGFDVFRAHRQADGAALTWSCTTPGVVGFTVERSWEAEFIGSEILATVSCHGTGSHKFMDEVANPGYNYYRITALGADGKPIAQSSVAAVRIVQRK